MSKKTTDPQPEEQQQQEPAEEQQHQSATTESVEDEVQELTNDLKRVQAEFLNFKRRAEEERTELLDFAKNRVVREFLAVRDNFDRELANRPKDIDAKWAESIDAIRKQFDSVLTSLGVERFNSVGTAFDPHLHEAVQMDDQGGAYEVVTEELQPGYKLANKILRHAIVKVGRTDQPPPGHANSDAATTSDKEKN
jgi:molecular chaperone GrpE